MRELEAQLVNHQPSETISSTIVDSYSVLYMVFSPDGLFLPLMFLCVRFVQRDVTSESLLHSSQFKSVFWFYPLLSKSVILEFCWLLKQLDLEMYPNNVLFPSSSYVVLALTKFEL